MKKSLIALLSWACLFAGCSADEHSEEASSSSACIITFDVSAIDTQTRGGTAVYNSSFTGPFKLWSYMQNTDATGEPQLLPMTSDFNKTPMTDKEVTFDPSSATWKTPVGDGQFYWPRPHYKLYCYAVYPSTAIFNAGAATNFAKSLDYTSTAISGDEDIMYAGFMGQRPNRDNSEKSRTVNLSFHHALSQIKFYGKLSQLFDDFGWQVEVNSITACNINSKGQFAFEPTTLNSSATSLAITQASPIAPKDYVLDMKPDRSNITTKSNPVLLTSSTSVTMVMPQKLTPWNTSNESEKTGTGGKPTTSGSYLAISMRIIEPPATEGADPKYPLGNNGDFVTVYTPFTTGVNDANGNQTGWEPAKTYKYTIEFGGGYDAKGNPLFQPIGITAAITPWTTTSVPGTATH
ncbi:MAG: fimbrillin family protein [Prevotella sp.]|nr:fimbrillin family protein [Prevotella sp.]